MSIGAVDSPRIRQLFKFLDKTKLSVGILLLARAYIQKYMGNGFKFADMKMMLAIGQSHLDAAWRWRKKQTVLKAKATFSKALQHMKEHPRFSYSQPSPAYYEWMKDRYPSIYQDIKDAVKRGQWVLMGGSWVEPDLNIPSGESLVRQRLVGMRFFLDEFGKMPDVEFMQDTFGFCWSYPQILAKSGAKMFGTGKIFWNDTNKFPVGMFHWLGPDGTALPTILIHFGYFLPRTYGKEYPDIYRLLKAPAQPGKHPVFDYTTPVKEIRAAQSRELMLHNIFGYGLGDGGHGPIEAEITIVNALQVLYPKTFKFYREGDFTRMFAPFLPRWPTWRDELYLELHRGVWTTNIKAKTYNRKLEVFLENTEKACCLASFLGAPYPKDVIDRCWKILLFNQFHDILPGSSIYEVYQDSFEEYETAIGLATRVLAAALDTAGAGRGPCLVNLVSWSRQVLVAIPGAIESPEVSLLDALQAAGLAQRVSRPDDESWLVLAAIDGTSITALDDPRVASTTAPPGVQVSSSDTGIVMDNGCLRVSIDQATGHVTSIARVRDGFEAVRGPANRILLFGDYPRQHHAWEIDPGYENKPIAVNDAATRVEIIERGPLRCGVEVEHQHDASTFVQRVYLCTGESMVRFSMDVDWHQTETLFKLAFPLNVDATKVSSGIPYAYIDRPVVPSTPMDKARWEYCYQGWVDMSDGTNGIGLLNDNRYGFNVKGNEVRLTVLNGPEYAGYAKETMFVDRESISNPTHVDQGHHQDITHVLLVHDGDWRAGATWREALSLANPVLLATSSRKGDDQGAATGEVVVSAPNVAITAMKVAEDEKDLASPSMFVLRLVEMEGKATPAVSVSLPSTVKVTSAAAVDLLERQGHGSSRPVLAGNGFSVAIGPHEIATIAVSITRAR